MDGSWGLEGGKPSDVFIPLTIVILAMTYGHIWAFVSAGMNHLFTKFQGCWVGGGGIDLQKGKNLCKYMD